MSYASVYVTASSRDEALTIARTVVGERLAACANVFPAVTSVYWWQDEMQEDGETVLVLKTRRALVDKLSERIRGLHSYDCPCVVALDVVGGNAAYLDWIAAETAGADNG